MTGGLIDVQGGLLRNDYGQGDWTDNKASLKVAAGATVDLWDSPGGITVDALTGSGVVTHTSYGAAENLTVGVNNGSGTFDGTITNQSGSCTEPCQGRHGTQTLTGANTYTGGTTVQNGALIFVNNHSGSSNFSTLSPGTLEFNVTSGQQQLGGGALTGNGTVVKSGAGELWLGANVATQSISMTGGLIDVQGGLLRNEWGRGDWTDNKASLRVAAGATVDLWDSPGGITVDALTGSGVVTHTAFGAAENLTVGVNNGSGTFDGTITNQSGIIALNLVKTGSGTQTLTGINTYTGTTAVQGGALLVNGTHTGVGAVSVTNAGSILGGNGSIAGAVTLNAGTFIAPGSAASTVGTLTLTGGLTFNATSTYTVDIGAGAANADKLVITGTPALLGNITFNQLSAPDQGLYNHC